MHIHKLRRADVPAALLLSRQAGWNQIEADWYRLIDLAPERCFGGWVDNQLVATATLISYGRKVGWIGMVLVDQAHRRRGYGSTIFKAVLQQALDDDLAIIGLDATEAGRTVYRKYDFRRVAPILRWQGILQPSTTFKSCAKEATPEHRTAIYTLDHHVCGIDRRALLEHMMSAENVTGFVVSGDNELRGYGMLRSGYEYYQFGPVVAKGVADLAALMNAAAEETNRSSIIIDAVANEVVDPVLKQHGLEVQRHLTRMTYSGPRTALNGEGVRFAAGFELC